MSVKEAKCNFCQANIKLSNAGPTNLKVHLAKHSACQKQFGVMENAEEAKKESMKQGLEKFVGRGTGELSALDRKNLPFLK
uniref:BED-type domain-containing protein n=1 Tax=Ditylenchus dipsaci TaxID=166011 RepID=A0A915CVC5_9BILA